MASIRDTVRESPNDLKLSDGGVRRGTCMVGGKAAAEAGAVTHGAVRCSAWLGVAVIRRLRWSEESPQCREEVTNGGDKKEQPSSAGDDGPDDGRTK